MPRLALTITTAPGGLSGSSSQQMTYSAGTLAVDGAEFDHKATRKLEVHNPTAGGITATVVSVDDSVGRAGDEAQLIGAGETYEFGPYGGDGWKQADGKVYVDVDGDGLTMRVVEV